MGDLGVVYFVPGFGKLMSCAHTGGDDLKKLYLVNIETGIIHDFKDFDLKNLKPLINGSERQVIRIKTLEGSYDELIQTEDELQHSYHNNVLLTIWAISTTLIVMSSIVITNIL